MKSLKITSYIFILITVAAVFLYALFSNISSDSDTEPVMNFILVVGALLTLFSLLWESFVTPAPKYVFHQPQLQKQGNLPIKETLHVIEMQEPGTLAVELKIFNTAG